jgi:outer membrane protein TolC
LQQTIYSESAGANITIAEKQLEAQKESYNASELDAILNGAIAYFNALIFKTNVRVQNDNLKATRRNLEIAQLNFEVGESSKYDELRFKSELASNTQDFIDANRDLVQSMYTINQLLNNPIELEIDIEQADIGQGIFTGYSYERLKDLIDNPVMRPALIEFLVEEAKKNSPELKNIGFSMEANERSYKLNSSGRFIPTVSLQGQYSLEFSRTGAGTGFPPGFGVPPDNSYNVGLNVSLPIFQQNQRNINKQSTIILQDQLDLFEQDTELAIEKNINDIMAELMNRIANIEISKVAEEAAKEALFLTQSSYSEGESLLIELVDAQNTYLRAQLSSATANYNYLLAAISLERSIGYFFLLNTESDNIEFMQRANQFIFERN